MRKFRNSGLVQQITWRVTLYTFIGITLLGISFLIFSFWKNAVDLAQETKNAIRFASVSLQQPVWTFDQKNINNIMDSFFLREDQLVVAARVVSRSNEILYARTIQSYADTSFEDLKKNNNLKIIRSTINFENKSIADVEFVFTEEFYIQENLKLVYFTLGYVIFASAILSLILFLLLKKMALNPLKVLINGVKQSEAANYNLSLDENFPYEMGDLSRAYNAAMRAIAQRDQALKRYTDQLENLVSQRTLELDEQRAKNIHSSRLAALGEFSAGIAHEINNPVTIIEGRARQLKSMVQKGASELEVISHIEKIRETSLRITKIIKGLRTFSRDGSHDPLIPVKVDKITHEVLDLVSFRIQNNNIDLKLDIENHDIFVSCREVQICQVLINLINNSMDAIKNLSDKWIELKVQKQQEKVRFQVTDSGLGIPLELQEKIMQPFFTTKEVGSGSGLGLSISLGIISEHQGQLCYFENQGHTSFYFDLQAAQEGTHFDQNKQSA